MASANKTPGPGQYNTRNIFQNPTGGLIGRKTTSFLDTKAGGVGPGQYETRNTVVILGNSKAKDKGFGSTGHIKLGHTKDKVPGPGQYTIQSEKYGSVGFGTSKRQEKDLSNKLGPGQYLSLDDKSSKFGKFDITMKFRHDDSKLMKSEGPGPG